MRDRLNKNIIVKVYGWILRREARNVKLHQGRMKLNFRLNYQSQFVLKN